MADLLPCPKCKRAVSIFASYGGRRDCLTAYIVECKCGLEVDNLGMGAKRSGVAAWNKYGREFRPLGGKANG